jgi:hypothetical protein
LKRIFIAVLFILFSLFSVICFSQESIYANKLWTSKIDTALLHIYNLQFDVALADIQKVESHYGIHPAVSLLKAQYIFWKERPLVKGTPTYGQYESMLKEVIDLADNYFEGKGLEMEKNFYLMAGYSLLTEQYAEDEDYWNVLSAAKYAYKYLVNGMGHEPDLPDYYFTSGLYNYYRVKYPDLHPFYKSFLWLFADGDKVLGIAQLKKASERSLFLKEQAYIYLFHIYLRYENNAANALPYARFLALTFPNNLRFITLYSEALIDINNYEDVTGYAETLSKQANKFYSIPGYLFKGLIAEHNNQRVEAKKYYNLSLSMASENEGEDDHFVAMVYAGLARLSILENDIPTARNYYELAEKMEPYVPVKTEAQAFFDKYD